MKRIFGFLLAFGLVFCINEAFADADVFLKSGAKVRYAIEKKVIPQAEADGYAAQGYVDLWTYALFNKGYWEKASNTPGGALTETMVELDGDKVSFWAINMRDLTHSYYICDKSGNYQPSGNIMFAGPFRTSTCTGDRNVQRGSVAAASANFVNNCCPEYAYSASVNGVIFQSYNTKEECKDKIDIWTDENGVEWYRLKLYQIRYEYPKVNNHGTTFYTRFYVGPSVTGDAVSNGASTFQTSYYGSSTPIKGVDGWGWSDADWSHYHNGPSGSVYDYSSDLYGYVIGGVEVISDPEMLLTAEATCGGTDLPGKLTVNDWAGKTWADYSGVKFFVNKTGGTNRKELAAGDLTATIPTSGTASEIAYTLTPSGYTMDGSYADSLIWVIEDTFLA